MRTVFVGLAVAGVGWFASERPDVVATAAPSPEPTVAVTAAPSSSFVPPLALVPKTDALAEFATGAGCLAWNHPHGAGACKSGCEASQHPTQELTDAEFDRLLASANGGSATAVDNLLYYGSQAAARWSAARGRVSDSLRQTLDAEFRRSHALVELRVVDAAGTVPIWIAPVRVPLDRRYAYEVSATDMTPPESSGTVKRLSRDFVWVRC